MGKYSYITDDKVSVDKSRKDRQSVDSPPNATIIR
jgi:hypothetical protein